MSERSPLHILHVASEVVPFSRTGGLADVAAALPQALASTGVRTTIVTPRYRGIDPERHGLARRLLPLDVRLGAITERFTVFEGRLRGGTVSVCLLDHPFYDRLHPYGDERGDYPDNGIRFALLGRAAMELAARGDHPVNVVHAHDWQAALALVYARCGAKGPLPATVLTIHNLAFQGLFPKSIMEPIGLDWDLFSPDCLEFFDQVSFLKAGIAFADRIITVSPRYAREIQTPELGCGLDGFLRERADRLVGILNGIDTEHWDPRHDPHLAAPFDATDLTGKATCKAALERELGLAPRPDKPLIGSISRLTEQKGFDLVTGAAEQLLEAGARMCFLGNGDARWEKALTELARRYPTRVAVRLGYDEPLAHRIEAGADLFLMPSRFEPCGLSQMYSHRYGTIPIVRATGGLDDTVVDYDEPTRTGTGFKFGKTTTNALLASTRRALAVYEDRGAWSSLIRRVMRIDHSWRTRIPRYLRLYEQVVRNASASAQGRPAAR